MMLFANFLEPEGAIKAAEFVKLGKKLGVPTFNDCSADVTPYGRLQQFAKSGFDLATVSGGKGICGPQSAGILFGRRDLIEAAKLNTSPYSDSIARGMKVNKEEMIGMMVALELFLKRDWDADWREYQRRAKLIADSVFSLGGITTEVEVPEIANHVPHLILAWDETRFKTRDQVTPQRTYVERKGFALRPKFVFIDGRTGTVMHSERFAEEILYNANQTTPALSSYFELMDRLIPSFLNTLSSQKIKGTRVLLQ